MQDLVGFLAVMEAAKWLVAGFFWIYICSASVEGKLTSRYNLFCAAAYSDRLVHAQSIAVALQIY